MDDHSRPPFADDGPSDAGDIDLGDTARQVGLFESANGLPHGVLEIVIAIGLALMLVPLRAVWRAMRHGDDPRQG
jgi:hypothetical protein